MQDHLHIMDGSQKSYDQTTLDAACAEYRFPSGKLEKLVLCGLIVACRSEFHAGERHAVVTLMIGDTEALLHDMSPLSQLDLITIMIRPASRVGDHVHLVSGKQVRVKLEIQGAGHNMESLDYAVWSLVSDDA